MLIMMHWKKAFEESAVEGVPEETVTVKNNTFSNYP